MATAQAPADGFMGNLGTGIQDWDVVYADCAPRVFNYFRYRLGNEVDAAELTSRTFERAWRSRMTYRKDLATFATWLFAIAKNVRVDYLKGRHIYLPIDAAANFAADETPAMEAERSSDLSGLLRSAPNSLSATEN
jgi:RNA polymerase sigma factor (sigma-70 family)